MKEHTASENLLLAFKRLRNIYASTEDLRADFPGSDRHFIKCENLLKRKKALDERTLKKIKKLTKFNRLHCILELSDKINDINLWFSESSKAAASFHKYWGLRHKTVTNIIRKYRRILLNGFLELAYRKGRGETEVDAIRSFRYNMGGRLPEEYFVNLVRGWISEDLASIWIEHNAKRIKAQLMPVAHDADRQIRFKSSRSGKGRVISGEPDFLVTFKNKRKQRSLEIQRVDRGILSKTNKAGERPVIVPGHRREIERVARKAGKKLVLFLFNEGTKTNPPEIAVVTNPQANKKLRTVNGNLCVWVKFFNVKSKFARKRLMNAIY